MAKRRTSSSSSRISSARWHRAAAGAPVHDDLTDYAKALLTTSMGRHSKNRARERIYEGTELAENKIAIDGLNAVGVTMARLNATKSIIDTFVSRLAKDRPMPAFDMTSADWELKQKGHKWRAFIVGKMLETEYDDLSRDQLLDGGVFGNGFIRIDDSENDVFAERIPVNEMLFDPRDCRYGKPRKAIRTYRIAKDTLVEMFPKQSDIIERAPCSLRRGDDNESDLEAFGDLEDYVDVFEAWYLPMSAESDEGRHAICIDGATLEHERWHEPRFPWSHLRLFKPRRGLYGQGFVDQLASMQHRVNCIVRDLQLNIAAAGRGFYAVNEANDIPTEMLSAFAPFKLKYKGNNPPVYTTPQMFNPAQIQALEFFIDKMYDLSGVSKSNATSKSSLGAGASGAALDTQYDIDSDRFRMPQSNYARARLDGAQAYIDASARVARRRQEAKGDKKSFVAVSPGNWRSRDEIEKLDYDKVALEQGQYRMKIEPVGFLPDTRAGKLAVVEQLGEAGVIPQWIIPTLFDEPDINEANKLLLAPYRNCMRKMDECTNVELPLPMPEAYNDLDLELKISTAFYNYMQAEKAPFEIQDRFKQYVDLVTHALKQKNAQTGAMPPGTVAPGAAPMGPAEQPMPGGVPAMPQGPVPPPAMIGAPPLL